MIATKVGYDFVHFGEARGRGQREIPTVCAGRYQVRDRRGAETIEDGPDRSAPAAQH